MPPVTKWTEVGGGGYLAASDVYGFTTVAELHFLDWYLGTQFTGRGAAVELGSALGRSTIAMLDGLSRNERASEVPLHVYDLFQFDWWLLEQYRKLPGVDASGLEIGDSFEAIFRQNLGSRAGRAVIHAGDIAGHPWTGGVIEFLFVDIMKNWGATRAVIESFFPALEAGLSILAHQDYKHPFSPQILLTMYRLRDYFEPAWSICGSGVSATVVFRCSRSLTADDVRTALNDGLCDLSSYTSGEIEAAIDHALAIVEGDPPHEVMLVKAARAVVYADLLAGRPDFSTAAAESELVCLLVQDRVRPFLSKLPVAESVPLDEYRRVVSERDHFAAEMERVVNEYRASRLELREIYESRAWKWVQKARSTRRRLRI